MATDYIGAWLYNRIICISTIFNSFVSTCFQSERFVCMDEFGIQE